MTCVFKRGTGTVQCVIESQVPDDIHGRPDREGGFIVSEFKVKNADSITGTCRLVHYWKMVPMEWHAEVGFLSKEVFYKLKEVLSDLVLSGDVANIKYNWSDTSFGPFIIDVQIMPRQSGTKRKLGYLTRTIPIHEINIG